MKAVQGVRKRTMQPLLSKGIEQHGKFTLTTNGTDILLNPRTLKLFRWTYPAEGLQTTVQVTVALDVNSPKNCANEGLARIGKSYSKPPKKKTKALK